jgi:D-threo-aldose 1-dehydrogenase
LQLTQVGFGTAPLATAPSWAGGEPIAASQAHDALAFAYEQGIRFFDTAPNYVSGLAETRLGDFLVGVPRDSFVVATKVGFDISHTPSRRDYTRDGILRSLEGSLKRLQVDAVDILHLHDADDYKAQILDEAFPALADLRSQGVVKAIGMGINQWELPYTLIPHTDFDCFMVAGRYTLLEQGAQPLYDLCYERGIALLPASIYNSGILATGTQVPRPTYNHGQASPQIMDKVRTLEMLCAEAHVSLHTAATHFPLQHPATTALVVGFQHQDEVRACLQVLNTPIPADFWQRLPLQYPLATPTTRTTYEQ